MFGVSQGSVLGPHTFCESSWDFSVHQIRVKLWSYLLQLILTRCFSPLWASKCILPSPGLTFTLFCTDQNKHYRLFLRIDEHFLTLFYREPRSASSLFSAVVGSSSLSHCNLMQQKQMQSEDTSVKPNSKPNPAVTSTCTAASWAMSSSDTVSVFVWCLCWLRFYPLY